MSLSSDDYVNLADALYLDYPEEAMFYMEQSEVQKQIERTDRNLEFGQNALLVIGLWAIGAAIESGDMGATLEFGFGCLTLAVSGIIAYIRHD